MDGLDAGQTHIGLVKTGVLTLADFPSLEPADAGSRLADGRLEP
jgi:hypothetical protein